MEEMLYNIFKTANAVDFFDFIKEISDKVLSKEVKPPTARMIFTFHLNFFDCFYF